VDFLQTYPILRDVLIMCGMLAASTILYHLTKRYVMRLILVIFRQTPYNWDERLYEQGVFDDLPLLVPAFVLSQGLIFVPSIAVIGQRLIAVWVIFVLVKFVDKLLSGALDIYNSYEISKRRPIKTYVQIVKLFIYIAAVILAVTELIGESPWPYLSGLGAITAVLMLVFQDTILGFIASVQINSNDLLRVGDWLDAPEFNADGHVIEIALHNIKVRNWDRTITTIPAHKLVSSSFKNWRGMFEGGGRRIKRSILIDQTSVRFCTQEMIEKYKKIHVLKDYIEQKEAEITQYNAEHGIDDSVVVNGRRMTNLGTFRAYISAYLRNHPGIHQGLTFLVRQMQPTRDGLPLEIYVFTKDTSWAAHEGVQADIFDHILAVVSEFDLRVAQDPTGYDLQRLTDLVGQGKGADGEFGQLSAT